MTDTTRKTVLIGIGESEDPLPDYPKNTRYWIFAGPCLKCGSSGRFLLKKKKSLVLICEECQDVFDTGLENIELSEVSYVYWCNSSKFKSDEVILSPTDAVLLKELEKKFGSEMEMPRWAVCIVGGICCKSKECINYSCIYNVKCQ
jgi:hypothetical protein